MSDEDKTSRNALTLPIRQAVARRSLTREQARAVMEEILSGAAPVHRIGMFLTALRVKGESVEELIGFAQAMRAKAAAVRPHRPVEEDISGTERDALVDTAGTGGDVSGTFNISTATALVVAGCGVRVAKHGNRSISSRCGSADVIEALGVNLNLAPDRVAQCIDEVGIGFMFAPAFHGAMKYAMPARRELRIRTVFNLLGPLSNPAGANCQVAGVYDGRLAVMLAEALAELGLRRAFVVHGADGLDEITNTGETLVAEVSNGQVKTWTLRPEDLGLPRCALADLLGGDVAENVQIIHDILNGQRGPKRDVVLMNAAAALVAAGHAGDFQDGIRLAAESIDSGAAKAKLLALAEFTNREFSR
ncbi:MAG: anthranilate phosphoribosyltransferase [Acidobacteria bacterium RIFCSPLOWO2_02_FULL_61_28]|nr:MAG: anthranilate phosphoribosyltransferase [Acidobacteria bacterium RIFCSPLOWO2_02_FULL_61_28]